MPQKLLKLQSQVNAEREQQAAQAEQQQQMAQMQQVIMNMSDSFRLCWVDRALIITVPPFL